MSLFPTNLRKHLLTVYLMKKEKQKNKTTNWNTNIVHHDGSQLMDQGSHEYISIKQKSACIYLLPSAQLTA